MTHPPMRRPLLDIRSWPLFGKGAQARYLVGSPSADRYFVVDAARHTIVMQIIVLLQQGASPEAVQQRLAEQGLAADVPAFLKLLDRAGLLEGSSQAIASHAAQPRPWSRVLLAVDLESWWPKVFPKVRWLAWGIFLWVVGSTLSVALAAAHRSLAPLGLMFASWRMVRSQSPLLGLGLYLSFWLMALPFHEGGHALLASVGGVYPRRLMLRLYLGIVPMVSIQLPGLYTLPLPWRVAAMAAGPLMNLAWGNTAWVLASIASDSMFRTFWLAFAALNYLVFAANWLPIAPLDGYYIISQGVFREIDIRARSWQVFWNWRKRQGPPPHFKHWIMLTLDVLLLSAVVIFIMLQVHRGLTLWLLAPQTWARRYVPLPLLWIVVGVMEGTVLAIVFYRLFRLLGKTTLNRGGLPTLSKGEEEKYDSTTIPRYTNSDQ